jgi:hypothetical protein
MAEAIRELQESGRPAEQAKKLQDEVDRLRAETAKLRERIDRLEARNGNGSPTAPPPPNGSSEKTLSKTRRPRPVARRGRPHRPVRR